MLTGLCLFVLDSLILGQGAIAVFTIIAIVLWFLPKTLLSWKRKEIRTIWVRKTLICTIMALAILLVNGANNHLARSRGAKVVEAINGFEARTGHYPASLEELIPEFLAEIPRAKYTALYNNFVYMNLDGHATIFYFDFPPYGRPYYDFSNQSWGYID